MTTGTPEGSLREVAQQLTNEYLKPEEETTESDADEPYEGSDEAETYEDTAEYDDSVDDTINTDGEESETLEASEDGEEEESFELDLANADKTLVKVKVNGVEETVTLAEALAGYSKERDYRHKTAEVARMREQFRAAEQGLQQREAQLGQYIEIMLNEVRTVVDPELQNVDWDRLARENPQKWAELKQKDETVKQRRAMLAQKQAEIQQRQWQEYREENLRKLPEYIPEWRDEKIYETERQELGKYLLQNGWSEMEVNTAADARAIAVARKAMLYDKMVKAQKSLQTKKTVPNTAVKTIKPGQAAPSADAKRLGDLEKQINSEKNLRRRAELITQYEQIAQRSKR